MKGLTPKQRDLLDYVRDYIKQHRCSPSYRDIQAQFGFKSTASVFKHIKALEAKGHLNSSPYQGRSLSLVKAPSQGGSSQGVELPLVGQISHQLPLETFAQPPMVEVPKRLVAEPDRSYLLAVRDHSLQEALLAKGDLLVVEAGAHVEPGETALVQSQEGTTIKRYFPEEGAVRLEGHSSYSEPLLVPCDEIEVQGLVRGLIRGF